MTHDVSFLTKGEMLDAIKSYLGVRKNTDFAKFLGISSQAVSNWYARDTFDAGLIYTKCVGINASWLLTGRGNMLCADSTKNEDTNEEKERKVKEENAPAFEDKGGTNPANIQVSATEILNIIRQQAEEIGRLKEKISHLEEINSDNINDSYTADAR